MLRLYHNSLMADKTDKLWHGRFDAPPSKITEEISESISFDQVLYKVDIRASLAHARMLQSIGVPVSAIICHDAENDVVAVEDLGDTTMAGALAAAGAAQREVLFDRALAIIARMQVMTAEARDWAPPLAGRCLDRATLVWEFDHYLEWGLCGVPWSDGELATVHAAFGSICDELAALDLVLTHRDFHVHNLMCTVTGDLAVIDFQDMLLANPLYDLASLLYDSYAADWIDDHMRQRLLRQRLHLRQIMLPLPQSH